MKSKRNKTLKIILIILAILLVLFTIAGFIVGNYFFDLALNPHSDKSTVFNSENNKMDDTIAVNPDALGLSAEVEEWFSESYQDDHITSYDDLKLHGYLIENELPSNKWAVIFHGYSSKGSDMKMSAKKFYDLGYNILLPDARGSGQSEGSYIGMGWHERLDAVNWINKIVEKDNDAQIALYGVSMGGATVMMISGEELPSNVKVIVEDCGYSSVWGEFSYQLKEVFNLPSFPIMNFASAVTKLRAGYTLGEADAVKQLEKSITPMLFIHGDSDTFVPSSMLDVVYKAANVPKEQIYVKGAGHGAASAVLGDEYWERMFEFVGRYIPE